MNQNTKYPGSDNFYKKFMGYYTSSEGAYGFGIIEHVESLQKLVEMEIALLRSALLR